MMRILMILNVLVMMVRCQRHRREVVRSHDGLFYHQGPYLSHNSHRQVTRQAPALFHRPPLLQPQPHPSTPVRFPQQHFAATGAPTLAITSHLIPHSTQQEQQSFIGPAPPPQPRQPLLPPVLSPQTAPALTFLDNTLRQQPQQLRQQPQQLRLPQQFRQHPQQFSAPQQPLLPAPSSSIPNNMPPPSPDHKPTSALEKLMAIAGEDWDLSSSSTDTGAGPEVFVCPVSEGHFRSPRDCSVYYQCAQGRAHRRSCHTGLAYDALTNQCDWAENVKC